MAINFPNDPVLNQSFVFNNIIYVWNGTSWVSQITNIEGLTTSIITQAAYDGLAVKDSSTLYFIVEAGKIVKSYLGIQQLYPQIFEGDIRGEAVYTTPGTYSWTAPAGVTSVSVVAIGGGQGGMAKLGNTTGTYASGSSGSLAYKNNIAVIPGQTYTVVVGSGGGTGSDSNGGAGGSSYFFESSIIFASGGVGNTNGTFIGDGGGNGASGGLNGRPSSSIWGIRGGSSAAGYSENGRSGPQPDTGGGTFNAGLIDRGATGLSQYYSGASALQTLIGGAGGGTGIYGAGTPGTSASASGSGGNTTNPNSNPVTTLYGGGGFSSVTYSGSAGAGPGGGGAVRIVWGQGRAFPSTDVGLTQTTFINPTIEYGSELTVSNSIIPFPGTSSYLFPGTTNGFMRLSPSIDWVVGTGDYTIEFFQRHTSFQSPSYQRIFSIGTWPSATLAVSLEGFDSGQPGNGTFNLFTNGGVPIVINNIGINNVWVHWAVVRSSGITRVYRNGQLLATTTAAYNINNTTENLTIGNQTNLTPDVAFNGQLTNFRWVNGIAVYSGTDTVNPNFTVPTSNLTAVSAANPYGGSNTAAVPAGATKLLLIP
jgi:hypothetical protein